MSTEARRLWDFPGGILLEPCKEAATAQPIEAMPLVDEYVLPLEQHIGEAAEPRVAPGDRVRRGELLARPSAYISAALHAPTSGTITAIEERPVPHPTGLARPCIVLRADGRDEALPPAPVTDYTALDPEALRERVREAGIVGLGGAAFPTWIKLAPGATPVEMLIINGAECEPYISCDDMLMRERAAEILSGTRIMRHALQAARAVIAVEDDKPEALAALRAALENEKETALELVEVPARYPEGGERQLIQTLTGREVPHDGLPLDIGMVCQNVGTAAAVHQAILHGEPLTSRIVTVAGTGVACARNLDVRIGTPMRALIEHCGGYTDRTVRLIMGGPMMGFTLAGDELPVVKATNCLLAAGPAEFPRPATPMPCIRCGDCAAVCPARLLPQQLFWHAQAGDLERARDYDLFDCIECGCCDTVCPSHIPLTAWFRYAKTEIWGQEAERAKADIARRRYEARQARLERERAEREARRRRKQETLEKQDAKAEIAAALERARKKKGRDD